MIKRKHLVVANWKMNPTSIEETRKIINSSKKTARTLKRTEVVICPPLPFLSMVKPEGTKIYAGAQNVSWQAVGSLTGEVSSEMVRSFGAKFAIIGHSERRALGETDEVVARKTAAALLAGLNAIVCVGEASRDQSGAYLEFLRNQIKNSLAGLKKKNVEQIIIAYEPIFAIGKSFEDAMQPSDVHETTLFIKKVISENLGKDWVAPIRILYGGSVNFENAKSIIEGGKVDGLLVGRESVNTETFPKLLQSVDAISF